MQIILELAAFALIIVLVIIAGLTTAAAEECVSRGILSFKWSVLTAACIGLVILAAQVFY